MSVTSSILSPHSRLAFIPLLTIAQPDMAWVSDFGALVAWEKIDRDNVYHKTPPLSPNYVRRDNETRLKARAKRIRTNQYNLQDDK